MKSYFSMLISIPITILLVFACDSDRPQQQNYKWNKVPLENRPFFEQNLDVTLISQPPGVGFNRTQMAVSKNKSIVAMLVADTLLFVTDNQGATWLRIYDIEYKNQKSTMHPAQFLLADGADSQKFYLIQKNTLIRSDDAGKTWHQITKVTGNSIKKIKAIPENAGMLIALNNFNEVLFSYDYGLNFRLMHQAEKAYDFVLHPKALNDTAGVVIHGEIAGRPGIYRTIDYGIHWHEITGNFPQTTDTASTLYRVPKEPFCVYLQSGDGTLWHGTKIPD